MDVSGLTLLYGVVTVFFAGVIKGLTGFGFSLVAAPLLVVLLGPRTAVPIIVVLNAFTNIVLFAGCRRAADIKRIRPLIIAGIITVPMGMFLLLNLDVGVLKLIIGAAIVLFAVALLAGFHRPLKDEGRGLLLAGLISGTLNGLISTGGPPVILFLANQGMQKVVFRASLIAYFLFLSVATIPIFLAGGLMSRAVLVHAAVFIPALLVGAFAGSKLLRRVPEHFFRVVALVIVIGTGGVAVLSGLSLI
jgi:uncharacterized membrane protein YfcA